MVFFVAMRIRPHPWPAGLPDSICLVNRRGADVSDLLVELALRDANLADALQLLLKILTGETGTTGADPLIIHHLARQPALAGCVNAR
jgi:hypothetical protein